MGGQLDLHYNIMKISLQLNLEKKMLQWFIWPGYGGSAEKKELILQMVL